MNASGEGGRHVGRRGGDAGGSVGYYAIVREPSGHLVEFTFGQPLEGLPHDGA